MRLIESVSVTSRQKANEFCFECASSAIEGTVYETAEVTSHNLYPSKYVFRKSPNLKSSVSALSCAHVLRTCVVYTVWR